jgi:hypothetical protein
MKPLEVATIAGDAEIDHAIATLVLAFATDPVARWMYDDSHQYNICCISRGYSEPSEQARLKHEQRSAPTTASGSRSGSHRVLTAMTGRSKRLSQKPLLRRGKPKSPPSSSGRKITGQPNRIGTFADRRRSFASQQGVWCSTAAAPPWAVRSGAPPRIPMVIEPIEYLSLRETWL